MSRIIKKPILLTSGITVDVSNNVVNVSGPLGKLHVGLYTGVSVAVNNNEVRISSDGICAKHPMLGTTHRLIDNAIIGVKEGFKKKLLINGVGYRAQVSGKLLKLNLGFSHPVEVTIPSGIEIKCNKPTEVEVFGTSKELVGQIAANIRSYREPEPYQGKGIRYENEYVFRKETKKK
jgi:large subunit ribosomal protein L6